MERILVFALVFTLFFGVASANTHDNLEVGPGTVGAESALYGMEIAWDNFGMAIGLKKPGTVAQERAAEAKAAQENGNSEAAQRAANEMSEVAERAGSEDMEGLQKAESVLQGVIDNAPEAAQQGLQTALDNVRGARERGQQAREDAGQQQTDVPGADRAPEDAQQRMDEARQLREEGRQQIDRGNTALDAGNYSQAGQHFEQAEQRFQEAEDRIVVLDSSEAQQLHEQLDYSRQGALDLVNAVQSYQAGDNATAEQYSQDAQDSFDNANAGGDAR